MNRDIKSKLMERFKILNKRLDTISESLKEISVRVDALEASISSNKDNSTKTSFNHIKSSDGRVIKDVIIKEKKEE